ncbi:MAG: hypothetical protein KDJ29_16060, partial [Hyphomicrobiales bacterium]|nr:hypothetical protein [Hyphomicrobiales bacterium]
MVGQYLETLKAPVLSIFFAGMFTSVGFAQGATTGQPTCKELEAKAKEKLEQEGTIGFYEGSLKLHGCKI